MEEDGFRLGAACRLVYELICSGLDNYDDLTGASGMKENNVRGRVSQLVRGGYVVRAKLDGGNGRVTILPSTTQVNGADGRAMMVSNRDLLDALDKIDGGKPFDSMTVATIDVGGRYLESFRCNIKDKSTSTEEAWLLMSDIHVGAKGIFLDKTKWEPVFKNLQQRTLDVLGHALGGVSISDLHVALLGDMVTGETVFPSQAFEIDMSLMEQLSVFVKNMGALLEALQMAIGGKVHVHCVVGNHGKVSRFMSAETNWDRIAYDMLALSLDGNEDIIFDISDEFFLMVLVKGHVFMLTHGDSCMSHQGIPLYGLVQAMMRWQMSLSPFDVLMVGHWHTTNMMQWNDCTLIMNGTTYVGDRFLLDKHKMKADANFWLFGVNEKRPITWQYRVDVDCRKMEGI